MEPRCAHHPLLNHLSEPERLALGACVAERTIKAGEALWDEGDDANFAALVISGRIELLKKTEFGGRRFVVGLFSSGSIVGEEALSKGNEKRPERAEVTEDCTFMVLEPKGIKNLADSNPAAAITVLSLLLQVSTRRLSHAYERLASIF
ncbi:MAG: hypothetical protein C0608_00110 [Deltaproteobacteria bacterium]|nr:MAG: hypothetical protein C0608_00110 [Deltaproteobacteria bacterium]